MVVTLFSRLASALPDCLVRMRGRGPRRGGSAMETAGRWERRPVCIGQVYCGPARHSVSVRLVVAAVALGAADMNPPTDLGVSGFRTCHESH
jgi:hypothetical protein